MNEHEKAELAPGEETWAALAREMMGSSPWLRAAMAAAKRDRERSLERICRIRKPVLVEDGSERIALDNGEDFDLREADRQYSRVEVVADFEIRLEHGARYTGKRRHVWHLSIVARVLVLSDEEVHRTTMAPVAEIREVHAYDAHDLYHRVVQTISRLGAVPVRGLWKASTGAPPIWGFRPIRWRDDPRLRHQHQDWAR